MPIGCGRLIKNPVHFARFLELLGIVAPTVLDFGAVAVSMLDPLICSIGIAPNAGMSSEMISSCVIHVLQHSLTVDALGRIILQYEPVHSHEVTFFGGLIAIPFHGSSPVLGSQSFRPFADIAIWIGGCVCQHVLH